MSKNNKCDYEDDLVSDLQEFKYKEMLEKADNVVLGFVATTGATGAIPIPFADAPLLIGEQVAMMIAINAIFKFNVSKDALKSLVTAAVGVGGATIVGKTIVSNALKFIPGIGSIAGGAISAATAGLMTLALGKAYIQVCKSIKMGKLKQDDLTKKSGIDALKAEFKKQIKKTRQNKAQKRTFTNCIFMHRSPRREPCFTRHTERATKLPKAVSLPFCLRLGELALVVSKTPTSSECL